MERAKHIMIDDAWTVLRNEGYVNQYEGGWRMVNNTTTTGRSVTAMYLPSRPDVEKNIKERGAKQVKNPVAVRFSFSNTGISNVFNKEGLPIVPFRTDNWGGDSGET